ncbi:helix-turn-helix domain-containing protein [Salidesulfovibrio brasiliensis]
MARRICAEAGFSQAKLAKVFGVSKSTVSKWKSEHGDFARAVTEGVDVFNCTKVEKSLLKRALGLRVTEKVFGRLDAGETESGEKIVSDELHLLKKVQRAYPPDTRACNLFLSRRDPERWPDKQQLEMTGSLNVTNKAAALSEFLDEIDGTTKGIEHGAQVEGQDVEAE